MKASKPLATMVAAATLMTPAMGLIAQSAFASTDVPSASEPSISDFMSAASKVKVLVNGKEYTDFNYMTGIDATKLLASKKAEVSYPQKGGTAIPDDAKITLSGVPTEFKQYITAKDVASGTDVVAKATGYTITYHFNYKKTSSTDTDTTKKGDVNKDGKYDVKDLAGVKATVDGKALDSFKSDQAGPYRIASGAKVRLTGVPTGWSAKTKSMDTGEIITVADPDGKDVIGYTFAFSATPNADKTDPLEGLTADERAYLTGVLKVYDAGVSDGTANIFDATKTLYTGLKGAGDKVIDVKGNIPTEDALFSYMGVNGKTQTGRNVETYKDGAAVSSAGTPDTEVLTFTGTKSGKTVKYVFTTLDHDPFQTTPSTGDKDDNGSGTPSTGDKDDNGSGTPSTPGDNDNQTTPSTPDDNGSGTPSTGDNGNQTTPSTPDNNGNQTTPSTNGNGGQNLANTGVGTESLLGLTAAVALAGSVMGLGALRRRD